jgi:hypothetical protein
VLNTKNPVDRTTLTRETLQTTPSFLVVSVNCIQNESLASIVVDVELEWQLAGGARANATIGIIAPFPPNRAANQLMRARDAFQQLRHVQATEEIREASLVFKLRFLHKESQDEPVEVHIAEINWYTEEDF